MARSGVPKFGTRKMKTVPMKKIPKNPRAQKTKGR
jgi:hypothetical protein